MQMISNKNMRFQFYKKLIRAIFVESNKILQTRKIRKILNKKKKNTTISSNPFHNTKKIINTNP